MCLLTFFPENTLPDIRNLRNGTYCNDDGHGYAIVVPKEKKIIVSKNMDAESLLSEFETIRTKYPEGPALFHSRFTTHGVTNEDNCHPFYVGGDDRTVLGHNGILPKSSQPAPNDTRSDTRKYAEDLLPTGRFGSIRTKRGRKRMAGYITSYNKFVILTVNPKYSDNSYIINEAAGSWEKGIWYSNDGYQGYVARTYYVPLRRVTPQCPHCYSFGTVDEFTDICRHCEMCVGCDFMAADCQCYSPDRLDKARKSDTPVTNCLCGGKYVCVKHRKIVGMEDPDDWFTFGKSDNDRLAEHALKMTGKSVSDMSEEEWNNYLADLRNFKDETDKEVESGKKAIFGAITPNCPIHSECTLDKNGVHSVDPDISDNFCWCDDIDCVGIRVGVRHRRDSLDSPFVANGLYNSDNHR